MTKAKRDISREILKGLQEIKRGQYGRVVTIPELCRTGRKSADLHQARLARYCKSLNQTRKLCSTSRDDR